jgi:hydrogenase expression/formation protein HypE
MMSKESMPLTGLDSSDETIDSALLPVGKLSSGLLASLIAGAASSDPDVVVGPGVGHDAAAVRVGDIILVFKNDPITFVTEDAPLYLINVNANDLACLGATPKWLLVTSLLPEDQTTGSAVKVMFEQLRASCRERGISLIGGHTEITAGLSRPIMVGTMIGTVPTDRLIVPGRAKPGDRIILTGSIAIEGTALLAKEREAELTLSLGSEVVRRAQALFDDPGISVVEAASLLVDTGGVTALHDPTEGGLAAGIREMASVAGCGAIIRYEQIPVLDETREIASHYGIDPLGMLSSGSLLAALEPHAVPAAVAACEAAGIPAALIGKIAVAERGFVLHSASGSAELQNFQTDEVSRALARP